MFLRSSESLFQRIHGKTLLSYLAIYLDLVSRITWSKIIDKQDDMAGNVPPNVWFDH